MTIKETKEFLGSKVNDYQAKNLSETERLAVKYPKEIVEYKPMHSIGEFLFAYSGSQFSKSKNSGSIVQDEDVRIECFTVVRIFDQGKFPEEYVELAKKALTGVRVNSNRAEKFIYPELTEWVKEENQYTWYHTIFVVPSVNIQINSVE